MKKTLAMKNEVLKNLTEAFAKAEDMNKESWEEEGRLVHQEESVDASKEALNYCSSFRTVP